MCVDHLSIQEVPGIYAITNIKNKKQYIGSSYNCRQRSYDHIAALKKNTHYSPHLQRSWNKYGEDSFTFVILACVFDINMLVEVIIPLHSNSCSGRLVWSGAPFLEQSVV